ncbi:hypothetical protein K450DRAFT_242541 [Umbelopsis ramanniana AG]|uniref:Uncharacterized protein n=1 Tax=Umbelopsis ramanniana AG TaxID=1314678 RepID=A0AAD5EBQ8_UMBRA|nr:uncharacterized protein K450DRAFT_242541 [Umbelopsis ramanniana AG]KAI8579295.1 hypothetical protein K450DRAFT_242541 [Umbelopsis ramanniana AG]
MGFKIFLEAALPDFPFLASHDSFEPMHEDNANIDLSTTPQIPAPCQEQEQRRGRRRHSVVTIDLPDIAPPEYTTATVLSKPPVYAETENANPQRPPRIFEAGSTPSVPSGGFYEQYIDRTAAIESRPRYQMPWYRHKVTMWVCLFAVIVVISVIIHFIHPNTL